MSRVGETSQGGRGLRLGGAAIGVVVGCLAMLVVPLQSSSAPTPHTAGENDRTAKLDLIDRLASPPGLLVLGSSRAKRAEPAQLQRLTGHKVFNAGVTGGTAADALVMTRYTANCFPRRKRRYIWFVDAGVATNGINPDLIADSRSNWYLGISGAVVPSRRCGPGDGKRSRRYRSDGSYTQTFRKKLLESSTTLSEDVAEAVAVVRTNQGRNITTDPRRLVWFEKALAFMNSQGARPVIVLNPIHPAVLAELRRYGFPARKAADEDFRRLRKRYSFVVVDAQDIRRWGGSPKDFWDARHINSRNMRRLVQYVVSHSGGALR
jgi:hypothetical protein